MAVDPVGADVANLGPSIRHLFGRLRVLEVRVRGAVGARREVDPDPSDRFRGLYITDAHVDELLSRGRVDGAAELPDTEARAIAAVVEAGADRAEAEGSDVRLRRLARSFELEPIDVELLLVALAPDLDARFERLYAYLQDDVSRRRASAGLALELCCGARGTFSDRHRLGLLGRLVSSGLLLVDDADRPFLTRALRVPDRVTSHLLGDDSPDPVVAPLVIDPTASGSRESERLARGLGAGVRLAYIQERNGTAGTSLAVAALGACNLDVLALDLLRLGGGDVMPEVTRIAAREGRLRGVGLVAGPVEVLLDRDPSAIAALSDSPGVVILSGTRSWDPHWAATVPLVIDAALPSTEARTAVWSSTLGGDGSANVDEGHSVLHYRLSPDQVQRAVAAARQEALADGRSVRPEDLRLGARQQNAAGLERLARRVRPRVRWDDLVLPPEVLAQLREVGSRARFRDVVLEEWGMGGTSSKGRGLAALFAGDSGTGKTMSAEVLAGDLGLDLYVIDLSTVIDKYVGETEKNLDRIFAEADRVNGVLLFDEADAVFGKRSDVKDSHDRYANVEVAYLLQRMEQFDGLAILTTNLRSNLDEAFTRRLDAVIDFPMPEEDHRRRMWERNLDGGVPRADDIDLDFLARSFKLSGGNIRNIALAGAYLAAAEARAVTMADLIHGTIREYQKLGRLTVESEFGSHLATTKTS